MEISQVVNNNGGKDAIVALARRLSALEESLEKLDASFNDWRKNQPIPGPLTTDAGEVKTE